MYIPGIKYGKNVIVVSNVVLICLDHILLNIPTTGRFPVKMIQASYKR